MTSEIRIHVVGLGPGDPRHVTVETRELLGSGMPVILRTRHHPSAEELAPNAESCDDLYRAGASFDEVYQAVVERVLERATTGPVVFAVPGSPWFAERTVSALVAAAGKPSAAIKVYPAVSFVDVAAGAIGLDMAEIQVCDATDLRVDTWRPALVHQVFDRDVVTALKLKLLKMYPPEHRVTVLGAVGTPNESIRTVQLAELDHRPFGYLDTLLVPAIRPLEDVRRFDGLLHVVRSLLAPGGCPWDREQTHQSLRPYLLEETYEALEAIDHDEPSELVEELGDVLFQTLIHTAIAENAGEFEMHDVIERIATKLIRRHPHVFSDGTASTAAEVEENWEKLKKAEKQRESILEGVPKSLPALAESQSLQGRARKIGFDWPDIEGRLEKLQEEIGEFAHAEGAGEQLDEFGDILAVLVNIADHFGLDAEQALRGANAKFRSRFGRVELLAKERDVALKDLNLAGLDELWDEAKRLERQRL
ncbi:MAG: nucleoside triphosphate pyrophosphohydrolase [Dehalococcoidia bacterium]